MRFVYVLARLYPYLAVAFIIALTQLGIYFRRKRMNAQWYCWGVSAILGIGIIAWFVMRGDLNTDEWLRSLGLTY
jgi:hypothetical protein